MNDKYRILEQYFGYTGFRDGQDKLIDAQLGGRDVIGVMPTGGGKSICYQVPAMLMDGITLVISPLISLMKDQVASLKKAGIPSAYINSSLSPNQIGMVYDNILSGQYKMIYVAPERLFTEEFLHVAKSVKISLLAVDEAHCISQWGQDFRPSYLKIVDFLKALNERPVVSAFTATATLRVREDIERILELVDPVRVITGFDRPNLSFEVIRTRHKPAELLHLVKNRQDKSGIIYCSTRNRVEQVCAALKSNGISAAMYHAGLSDEERRNNQDDFTYDRCGVIVATNAFGMGIDKSNVAYVIHYNMPQSIEAYYQEAGRAGRDGSAAECILMFSEGDIRTARFLIENPGKNDEIPAELQRQITQQELVRLQKMIGYCETGKCLRKYILDYFGEDGEDFCGNCGNCDTSSAVEKDITIQAQMILSCVKRVENHLGYSLGANGLANVLRGSRGKRTLELGLDNISTYALMCAVSRDEICDMINSLEAQGYLRTDPLKRFITLTERAGDVLFRGKEVKMKVHAKLEKAALPKAAAVVSDDELFAALKALRLRIAAAENVPAYIVFSNAALTDMAAKKPTTIEEFLQIYGVGRHKAEQYGEVFLAEIARYLETEENTV